MKLLVLILILISPCYLLAQENIKLGQSKDEIRNLLKSYKKKEVKISEGNNCDTITVGNGVMQTLIYYKNNNICDTMKVTMLWVNKGVLEQQFINNSFIKLKEGVWINEKGKVRIDISSDKSRNSVTMIQTRIN